MEVLLIRRLLRRPQSQCTARLTYKLRHASQIASWHISPFARRFICGQSMRLLDHSRNSQKLTGSFYAADAGVVIVIIWADEDEALVVCWGWIEGAIPCSGLAAEC